MFRYFCEQDVPNTKFVSIPAACWWCVITLTSVGYGDIVPVTVMGKCIASCASIIGILVLATPVSLVVDKFADAQERLNKTSSEHQMKKVFAGKFGAIRRLKNIKASMAASAIAEEQRSKTKHDECDDENAV